MIKELNKREWRYEDIEFWKNPKDGCWNSIIQFEGKSTRLRSSIIIMTDNNEILLCKDTYTGELCIPGGGFEPGETPEEVAIREAHEEVGIDVKDVEDTECDYCSINSEVKDWVRDNVPEEKWWYNYYSCLMIGNYNKIFKGKVAEVDKEPALKNSAKFYPLSEIVNHPEFKNCWKRALVKYGYLKQESLNEVYPNKGESKKDFIARFMKATKNEYPDIKQRYAVANSYWDRRNKKKVNEEFSRENLKQIALEYIDKMPSGSFFAKYAINNISPTEWEDIEDFFNSLYFPLPVYRGLRVKSPESIDLENIGVNWTVDKNLFTIPNSAFSGVSYIVSASADKEDIDWPESVYNYTLYSLKSIRNGRYPENEVVIKKNVKLKDIKVLDRKGNVVREDFHINKLTEATLSQIINKSKSADKYKKRQGSRWDRKSKCSVEDEKSTYNDMDMNTFWKQDILDINIPVKGETDSYKVELELSKILDNLKNKITQNKNKLTEQIINQCIQESIDRSDLKVKCNCADYKYRLAFHNSKNKINKGKDEDRASDITNPKDTKGAGCKHILKILDDSKLAEHIGNVIYRYINYCKLKMHYNYINYMFPKIFGITEKEAKKLINDTSNKNKEEVLNLSKAISKEEFK